jgi:hypothetical protein
MTKISQLTSIGTGLAADDEFIIRDVSDASTPNKKVTASGFFAIANTLGITGFDNILAGIPSTGTQVRVISSGIAAGISGYAYTTISGITVARTTISGYYENASGVVGGTLFPVVTQTDIGTDANQVPLCGMLGSMAFQDSAGVNIDQAAINTATISSAAVTAFSNVPLLTGGGLKFPPTQILSADPNTLDDYEEGTWTAAITATGGGSQTYTMTASTASYTKTGNVVHLFGRLEWTYSAGGSPSNSCSVNLPFSAGSTSYQYRSSSFVGTSNTAGVILTRESSTSASFFSNMSGGGAFFYLTYMIGP